MARRGLRQAACRGRLSPIGPYTILYAIAPGPESQL